ncbi:MAG: hypothetical protein KKF58_00400 [Gammaproteobacteria bacterium]|nr:hypothetical protein [Gammaproteobacteria bacterium]
MFTTNSLGFKDRSTRQIPIKANKYRLLFIGDSFTEGIGYSYEKTFAGLIDEKLHNSVDVLNAGVASYSPKLYFSKIKYLVEEKKLSFDEVALFIDISDIQDEIVYGGFSNIVYIGDQFEKIALDNSMIARVLERKGIISKLRSVMGLNPKLPENLDPNEFQRNYNSERGRWTYDSVIYDGKWGAAGVELAVKNVDDLYKFLLARNIKLSITVYPWPEQIIQHDLDSKQVHIWRTFSQERSLDFINLFPPFFSLDSDPSKIVSGYFIKGDNHWNASGHAVVAQHWMQARCPQGLAGCFQTAP